MVVKTALDLGLPALIDLLQHVFGQAGDRPVGTREEPGGRTFTPATIGLAGRELARVAAVDLGYGRGVIPIRYSDSERLAGDYSIYVQVDYSEYSIDLNQIPG